MVREGERRNIRSRFRRGEENPVVPVLIQCQQKGPTTAPGLSGVAFQGPGNIEGPRRGLPATDPFLPGLGSPQYTGSISPPSSCQQKDQFWFRSGSLSIPLPPPPWDYSPAPNLTTVTSPVPIILQDSQLVSWVVLPAPQTSQREISCCPTCIFVWR